MNNWFKTGIGIFIVALLLGTLGFAVFRIQQSKSTVNFPQAADCGPAAPACVQACYAHGSSTVAAGNCSGCWNLCTGTPGGNGGSCFDTCFGKTGNGSLCTTTCNLNPACVTNCNSSSNYLGCVFACVNDTTPTPPPATGTGTCVNLSQTHLGCLNNTCAHINGAGANTDGCSAAGTSCQTSPSGGQVTACWGNLGTDGKCYDCNGDGVINILDFSCFAKHWLEKV